MRRVKEVYLRFMGHGRLMVMALGLAFGLAPIPVRADVIDTAGDAVMGALNYLWPDDAAVDELTGKIGLGFGLTPDYVGSNNYKFRVVPLLELRFRDVWAFQGSKLRINIIKHPLMKAGPLVNYMFGRDADNNRALTGMGNISDTVQLGWFVEGQYKNLIYSADIRKALGAKQGTTARLIMAHGIYQSEDQKTGLALAFRMQYGSDRHNQTNFGVTAAQNASSGNRIFDADGGINSMGLFLIGRRKLDERFRLEWIASYTNLVGDAADSPLVKDHGDRNQFLLGAGIRYAF